jgi:nucleotide-binding universal stress UspA family protein
MSHKTTSILLCLDLERGSGELANFCADCAARWGYPVHVIHAHSDGGRGIKEVEAELKTLVDETLGDVEVQALYVCKGLPEDSIIEYATEKIENPVIILGRRKRSIADRIYVGSTTSAVISLSEYPVMVVPLDL